MKTFMCIVFIGISSSLMGCLDFNPHIVRSLFPLFREKEATFSLSLVGAWSDKEGKETYLFQKGEGKNYTLILMDKKDTIEYKVQLGQLGNFWFMDSYPSEKPADVHMISSHLIFRMLLQEDSIGLSMLDSDSLKKMIESGNMKVPAVILDGSVILTASTEELQQFIQGLTNDDRFFPESSKLFRIK